MFPEVIFVVHDLVDHTIQASMVTEVLAQLPGQNLQPGGPEAFTGKTDRGLNFMFYVSLVIAMIGTIATITKYFIDRARGAGEEATTDAVRVGLAIIGLSSVSSIFFYFFSQ